MERACWSRSATYAVAGNPLTSFHDLVVVADCTERVRICALFPKPTP
jgi:hypothetical protein